MSAAVDNAVESGPLTRAERGRLAELESAVDSGLAAFVAVGNALAEIRDSRLYRSTHPSFEAYCTDRWQLVRSRAYQLIDAAVTVGQMSKILDTATLPAVESHAAALAGLSPEIAAEVYRQAQDSGKVTAAKLSEIREQYERDTGAEGEQFTPDQIRDAERRTEQIRVSLDALADAQDDLLAEVTGLLDAKGYPAAWLYSVLTPVIAEKGSRYPADLIDQIWQPVLVMLKERIVAEAIALFNTASQSPA